MKISGSDIILLRRALPSTGQLRSLKTGDEIPARIIARGPGGMATLSLGAGTITARFTAGVPKADSLVLRLVDDRQGTLVFRLVEGAGADRLRAAVAQASPFGEAMLAGIGITELARALSRMPARVFDLGLLLLKNQAPGAETPRKPLAALFNRLRTAGVPAAVLRDIAWLVNPDRYVLPLLSFMGGAGQRAGQGSGDAPGAEAAVDRLLDALASLADDELRGEAVSGILDALADGPAGGLPRHRETVFFDGEGFAPLRVIETEEAVLLATEWSHLGAVDILVRRADGALQVKLFCASAETAATLGETLPELERTLGASGMPVQVSLHHNEVIFKKMIEIISSFNLNSAIDLKV